MDYEPIKPYLKRNMERNRLHGRNTICSTIRDIYMMAEDERIKLMARIAMRQSKNLYTELKGYSKKLC